MSTIDLKQFHATFFAESFDGLASMESNLLKLEQGDPDSELLNAIFRAIHSIKGSSGTFGFNGIAQFTHTLETLLDEIRQGKRAVTPAGFNILLESVDCLRHMLSCAQDGSALDLAQVENMSQRISALAEVELDENTDVVAQVATTSRESVFHITFRPSPRFFHTGNDPLNLFRLLETMGELETQVDLSRLPTLEALDPENCYFAWQMTLRTEASRADIEDVFDWVVDDCEFVLSEAPSSVTQLSAQRSATSAVPFLQLQASEDKRQPIHRQSDADHFDSAAVSIHVSTKKVDRLINMVGELVITQSMLNQIGTHFDLSKLALLQNSLVQLERNTRELQESVMSIRMVPISYVFTRYVRMVRDMAAQLDKKIELKISGEQCELDKSLIEKIVDPLTHLIRNSIDHGIESPARRKQQGKPEHGTIWLHAEHSSGSVAITLRDDGEGLNQEKIRAKAIEQGLFEPHITLSPDQVEQLIFLPGFSTATTVSDISGRGVGLDVVRSNIQSIGGTVDAHSVRGSGTQFTLRVPLTLAILDGLLVAVGKEIFILPLVQVIESLRPTREDIKTVAGESQVLHIRDEYLSVVALHELFSLPNAITSPWDGILVLLEAGGTRFALLVDDLVNQQQVVMKSLESNYQKVDGMLGATILGDGKVALILDVTALLRLSQKQEQLALV